MTAGIWALERLSPKLYRRARAPRIACSPPASPTPRASQACALQVNAFGSLLTPFFTSAPVRDYRRRSAANTAAYATFFRGMLTRGIYPPPSQFEAWFLSAAHTDRDVRKTIAAANGAMKEVARAI